MKNNTQMKIIVRNNDVGKALRILKKKLNIGDMAPNFSAPDADGKLITLK